MGVRGSGLWLQTLDAKILAFVTKFTLIFTVLWANSADN